MIRCARSCAEFKSEHETLKGETETELVKMGADIKEPSVMAKGMSWIKTNMQMAMDESDKTIANIMTDGCNMGIKNLNKYLNEYSEADRRCPRYSKAAY